VWSKVDVIEHKPIIEIKGILRARQTHLRSKEYLGKYKGYHHKEAIWMELVQLNHLLEMVNKFEQERAHELGMKKTWKKKKNKPTCKQLKCR
jgi:hypothetical protein